MSEIQRFAIEGLRAAREDLLAIQRFDQGAFKAWLPQHEAALKRGAGYHGLWSKIVLRMRDQEHDKADVHAELRLHIVEDIDAAIRKLDRQQVITPILESLILQVKDTKLSTLLKEFNAIKDLQPNLAAIGFRTILSLIIVERAKVVKPPSPLAAKQDLALEGDYKDAIAQGIFDAAESRALDQFFKRGQKDTLDIVAHKTGTGGLIDKGNLSAAVDLLNRLLPTII